MLYTWEIIIQLVFESFNDFNCYNVITIHVYRPIQYDRIHANMALPCENCFNFDIFSSISTWDVGLLFWLKLLAYQMTPF